MIPLRTESLAVGYRGSARQQRVVLADLDLTLARGELVCLVGPNGSGKSTLLRTIAGMQPALSGRTLLGDDDVATLAPPERARRLAVVLTEAVDVGVMTATDLVALGRYPYTDWAGRLSPSDWEAVRWAMEATGASALADRQVVELSDGERQRVLIARALAQQPQVLALDEAVAFVDVPRRVELVQILRDLARECGLALVLTTHDLDLAIRHADRLWLLEPGDPRSTLHVGGPEDLVLAGAVARAFHSDEVAFDLERGAFVTTPAVLARVAVVGHGHAAIWTRRAMEREGLAVVDRGPLTVEVQQGSWRVVTPGETTEHATIAEVVERVRTLLPALAEIPREAAPAPDPPPSAPA